MPSALISQAFITDLAPVDKGQRVDYFDAEIKGFTLEVRPAGVRTFYFRYRDPQRKVCQVQLGKYPDMSVSDARAKAHQLKALVKDGGDPRKEVKRNVTVPLFNDFIVEKYLPFAKVRKRSWGTDECILRNHLIPRFGSIRLNRITRADVQAMQFEGNDLGYAPGTVNRWLILLRFIFNCAIRWEIIPEGANPTKNIDQFDDNGARERYLTEEEVRRLYEEIEKNRNTQVGRVVKLLLLTGARKREVLDARWEYIDFERRLLTVPLSKSGKPRHIPLSDGALELLRSLPREEDIPWVFFNPKTRKPPVSIFYAWDTMRMRIGIKDVRLHDLRHSYASFLVNQGRSLYEVQRLLGHADSKTTQRYAHLSPGALIDAVNVVGSLVARSAASAAAPTS